MIKVSHYEQKENLADTVSSELKKENTPLVHNIQTSFGSLLIANISIIDSMGQKQNVRLMLDSGSDATLISESHINYLGLKNLN